MMETEYGIHVEEHSKVRGETDSNNNGLIHEHRLINRTISPMLSQEAKIAQWLHQYGFAYNPFRFTDSERDVNLDAHFVEYPDFDKMLDLDDQVLFARTGDGKTAARLRLQSFYREALADQQVFAFSYLIPQWIADSPPANIEGHLEPLLTAAVSYAFVFFALRGLDLSYLQRADAASTPIQQLRLFFDAYYGLLNGWEDDLQQGIEDHSLKQAVSNLTPIYDDWESLAEVGSLNVVWARRWLELLTSAAEPVQARLPEQPLARWHLFCHLMQEMGVKKNLVLVDGVDVKPAQPTRTPKRIPQTNPETDKTLSMGRMKAVAAPLLAAISTRALGDAVSWKLFLPAELYLPLIPLFTKQISHVILYWDYERLRQLLKFRLSAATQGTITTLLQISEDDVLADLETFLIVQSESSPRYLIHYINKIFGAHVDQSDGSTLPGKLSGKVLAEIAYPPHRSP
ncbi:MAG: hypothetical protein R3A44_20505 [Caldilineaceae bacterium]